MRREAQKNRGLSLGVRPAAHDLANQNAQPIILSRRLKCNNFDGLPWDKSVLSGGDLCGTCGTENAAGRRIYGNVDAATAG
jgi:hypothetical protein